MATRPQSLLPDPPDTPGQAEEREAERQLVARAQVGDPDAFEAILRRFEPRILRLARRVLGDAADATGDAEDVLQETFLKVHRHLAQFQHQSRLYTWIVRIAVNEALMKLRRRRGNIVSLDEEIATEEGSVPREIADWHPSPEEQRQMAETAEILHRALAGLSVPYRVVFQLRDVDELSTQETAEILGISEAAVKSRLLRARLQLRERLASYFRPHPPQGAPRGV